MSAAVLAAVAELMAKVDDLAERLARLEHASAGRAPRTAWKLSEVAQSTGISYDHLLAMVKSGELGSVRAGRLYIVPDEELRAFLARGVTRRLAVAS